MNKSLNVTIVIPCLNEITTIEKAVKQAKKACKLYAEKSQVLVSDNGSTDGSLKVLKKIRSITVFNTPQRGYGAALHFGILNSKFNNVLFADADLSYDFMALKKFAQVDSNEFDLILGSRLKGRIKKNAMPFLNRFVGTPLLSLLIRLIYGIKTSDCNSGMRMIKKNFYKKLGMRNSGMEWASELIVKTALNNGRYTEVPINFQKDKRGGIPHLKRWEDGWKHLKVIFLLKPGTILIAAVLFTMLGLKTLVDSLFTTIAMFLLAEFTVLSYLAAIRLQDATSTEKHFFTKIIDSLPLVMISVVVTLIGLLQLFLISDDHLFTKYILLYQAVIFDLWVFFVETLKTHLENLLPEA